MCTVKVFAMWYSILMWLVYIVGSITFMLVFEETTWGIAIGNCCRVISYGYVLLNLSRDNYLVISEYYVALFSWYSQLMTQWILYKWDNFDPPLVSRCETSDDPPTMFCGSSFIRNTMYILSHDILGLPNNFP